MPASSRLKSLLLTAVVMMIGWEVAQSARMSAADDAERPAVSIRGTTGAPRQFTLEEIRKLPRVEVETVDRKGQKVAYAGVAVADLLEKVETARGETLRGEWLRAFVTVDARDEYRAVFALPEFDSAFTDRVIILAYERDGKPLDEQTGPLQIIVPGEKKHARWVRMVKEIRVLDSKWVKD